MFVVDAAGELVRAFTVPALPTGTVYHGQGLVGEGPPPSGSHSVSVAVP